MPESQDATGMAAKYGGMPEWVVLGFVRMPGLPYDGLPVLLDTSRGLYMLGDRESVSEEWVEQLRADGAISTETMVSGGTGIGVGAAFSGSQAYGVPDARRSDGRRPARWVLASIALLLAVVATAIEGNAIYMVAGIGVALLVDIDWPSVIGRLAKRRG